MFRAIAWPPQKNSAPSPLISHIIKNYLIG